MTFDKVRDYKKHNKISYIDRYFPLAKKFLEVNLNNDISSVYYKRCYYAVAYLIQVEGLNFEEIIASEYSLEDVLCKIEKMENKN